MTQPLRFRIQEWFADRYSWAQYPAQRSVARRARPPAWQFENVMSPLNRISLVLISVLALLIGFFVLGLLALGIYLFFPR
ncbi:hypothetical protein ISN76_12890 [Dyella halodurans]|uniref:Uncharacterized protein n=1 Tax=Dyella halodurans TaxID=1920171 RepID=A0ABV9C0U0_9GAMM|nr:hypothetical protein [Dyella halodurans]